ncbi:MAG: short chain dehydrogenase [Hyphomicrobiales bacterium]
MKNILLVGASGTIGKAIYNNLKTDYNIITAGRQNADLILNVNDRQSIDKAFENLKNIDGVINTFGALPFEPFDQINMQDFANGMNDKFLGQANIVQAILPKLNHGASIVLTSGILNHQPIHTGVLAAAANGAIDGFGQALALELGGKARVNIVSPSMVADSIEAYGAYFDGYEVTQMDDLVNAYRRCLSGIINGKVIKLFKQI